MSYYSFQELIENVYEYTTNTKENRLALIDWFREYGMKYWNGECWSTDVIIDNKAYDIEVKPIYIYREEYDEHETVDGEVWFF